MVVEVMTIDRITPKAFPRLEVTPVREMEKGKGTK